MPRRAAAAKVSHSTSSVTQNRTSGREGGVPASAEVVRPAYAGLGFLRHKAAEYWSFPLADFRVLPNGVNVEQFSPDDSRRGLLGNGTNSTDNW